MKTLPARLASYFVSAILLFAVWELIVLAFRVPEYLIPSPASVFKRLMEDRSALLSDTLLTTTEAILGFLLGSIIGFLASCAFLYSRRIESLLYPQAVAFKAIPLVAIAPLITVWFGNGILGKVIMAASISFFPSLVNSIRGLRSVTTESVDVMKSLAASEMGIFWYLRLPSAMPYIFSALKVSIGLSVVGAVVAEMAGSDRGIGHLILVASYQNNTTALFTAILAISFSAVVLFEAIDLVERRFVFWAPEE